MATFTVEAELHGTATVTVEADNEDEAQELALEMIENEDPEADIQDATVWHITMTTEEN